METTKLTSHKLLLVSSQTPHRLDAICSPLEQEGLSYTISSIDEISTTKENVSTPLLYIHTSELTQREIDLTLQEFPELTGVVFFFDDSISHLSMMREIAVARTNYIAVIGALFVSSQHSFGVSLCRKVGIPYLHQISSYNEVLPRKTVEIFTNMIDI